MISNPRKYTNEQIKEMEHMRYQLRMSFLSIALYFGTTRKDIERQFKSWSSVVDMRGPLRVPNKKINWDFSGMDV